MTSRENPTIGGRPVTGKMIDDWAKEAERGYDVDDLRRRGRPSMGPGPAAVVPVRIDPELLDLLNERARSANISRSEAIREAIRQWTSAA